MALTTDYSDRWKDLGTLLVYQSDTFQFKSCVVITDFEQCLIKRLSSSKLYHAIDPKSIEPYNKEFLSIIERESLEYSIVIISNVFIHGKLALDSLKQKFEMFVNKYKMPLLAIFALKKNRLSKPHTGSWMFLNAYFKKFGDSQIQKACVVSDFGGRLAEHELKNGRIRIRADNTDLDRAFANNIRKPYHTILEYIHPEKREKFNWNSQCLDPETREMYIKQLSKYKNPNIFAKMFEKSQADKHMIIIYGSPRSGKTTLAKELLSKWRTSSYGKNHVVKRFGLDKYSKGARLRAARKALENRISVIIDGGTHTEDLRRPFEELAAAHKITPVYVEVNPGLAMASIFNHVAVETAVDESVELYDIKDYHYYKSTVNRPKDVILYCPVIKKTDQVITYRY